MFNACGTGFVLLVRELVENAKADPNLGIGRPFPSGPLLPFGRLGFPHSRRIVAGGDRFCQCSFNFRGNMTNIVVFDPFRHVPDQNMPAHSCKSQLIFPLHLAAASGNVEIVKLLVDNGAHLEAPCFYVDTPPNVQGLDDLDATEPWQLSKARPANFMLKPLYLAVIHGHVETAARLLDYGASSTNLTGTPPSSGSLSIFHVAVGVRGPQMTQLCIDRGLDDIHGRNYAGLSPIWLAIINRNWEVLDLLVSLGADLNDDLGCGYTPLRYALNFGDREAAQMITTGAKRQGYRVCYNRLTIQGHITWRERIVKVNHDLADAFESDGECTDVD
ncbi:ankyrin repeat-containing domain protein [Rhypophila decipiens]|uniref:Ankyrin repeat-containing domain protein n=1 Tax=Rhypophila decipiens TaxID=261697 RepID=A0AAN6Y055_9PEZI|nr:ankyrin repeat-containing domain protein [Rhypophila decipiens]